MGFRTCHGGLIAGVAAQHALQAAQQCCYATIYLLRGALRWSSLLILSAPRLDHRPAPAAPCSASPSSAPRPQHDQKQSVQGVGVHVSRRGRAVLLRNGRGGCTQEQAEGVLFVWCRARYFKWRLQTKGLLVEKCCQCHKVKGANQRAPCRPAEGVMLAGPPATPPSVHRARCARRYASSVDPGRRRQAACRRRAGQARERQGIRCQAARVGGSAIRQTAGDAC